MNANPASNECPIPTTVAFDDSVAKRIGYPLPISFQPTFANEPIKVYEWSVVMSAIFPPGVLDRKDRLAFTVTAQACTKEVCLCQTTSRAQPGERLVNLPRQRDFLDALSETVQAPDCNVSVRDVSSTERI